MPSRTNLSEPIPTVAAMPHWILFLVLAIVAWLTLAVGGGLLIGRLLGVAARYLPHPRRRIA